MKNLMIIIGLALFGFILFQIIDKAQSNFPKNNKRHYASTINHFNQQSQVTPQDGQTIFQANCASCHHPLKEVSGPMMKGLFKRRSEAWVRRFISNSSKMIQDNGSIAKAIYLQYNKMKMPAFEDRLNTYEMDKLIDFLKGS